MLDVMTDDQVSPQGPFGCSQLPCTMIRDFSAQLGVPCLLVEGPVVWVMEGMLTQQLKRLTWSCEKC